MSPGHFPSLRINNNNNSITSFSFLMIVFLALINLKFQPRNIESPFETQGVVMAMFVICMLVYSITLCIPYFPEVMEDINLLAGSLATALLAFTLLPGLGWVILFIWTIHFVKLIDRAISKLCPFLLTLRVVLGRHAHHNEERCCSNHIHASLGFLISVLLALIPVNYQSTNMAVPFDTHPAIMFIFIAVILVYAAAAAVKTSNDNSSIHRIIVTKISLLSGSLATVILLLVIVPPIGWFVLLIWTFFLVKQIYDGCQMLQLPYWIISVVYYVLSNTLFII
ncbi:hypothetical protein ES332_A10G287100v1 [Gossypium tomentosum]|uniref:Uncharacterized protein n=1 Tax=Gossypium tomentosum TaxID=34277 RepID=A0A5D2P0U4_GOSTO|nr:hypothetical protein ES332_A10G287100v1 [Gossypium tomentosum]